MNETNLSSAFGNKQDINFTSVGVLSLNSVYSLCQLKCFRSCFRSSCCNCSLALPSELRKMELCFNEHMCFITRLMDLATSTIYVLVACILAMRADAAL